MTFRLATLAFALVAAAGVATAQDSGQPGAVPAMNEPLAGVFADANARGYEYLGGPGRYFPDRAARTGISGTAVLNCLVGENGSLDDCRIVVETPDGYGFGAAARVMAERRAVTVATADGVPAVGERRNVRVAFPTPGPKPCPRGSRQRHC